MKQRNEKKNRSSSEDRVLYWILIGFLLFAALFIHVIHWFGLEHVFMKPCPVYEIFGLYCPGCGGTRALMALAAGDVWASLRIHPLVPCAAGFLVCFLGSHTLEILTKGRVHGMKYRHRYLIAAGILLAGNWVIKNYVLLKYGMDLLARETW